MTDRINLTQLRANTEAIRQGAERHDQAASMLTVDQALALIDAAEAAQQLHAVQTTSMHFIVNGEAEDLGVLAHLAQALSRFDFGETSTA